MGVTEKNEPVNRRLSEGVTAATLTTPLPSLVTGTQRVNRVIPRGAQFTGQPYPLTPNGKDVIEVLPPLWQLGFLTAIGASQGGACG